MESQRQAARRARADERYREQVAWALDRVHRSVGARTDRAELGEMRWVIFSDHHKGGRDRADDFWRCERAYNAALAWYFRMGYTLVVLGDAEELLKDSPRTVIDRYQRTLELEACFHAEGRHLRFWGNHDDLWRREDRVRRWLWPVFPEIRVREAAKVEVTDRGRSLGHLFFVHGHQGTTESDLLSPFTQPVVRYVWGPFQRVTGRSLNTPSEDWVLRAKHDTAMYAWAERQGFPIFTGHTHRPVFASTTHADKVKDRLERAEIALRRYPGSHREGWLEDCAAQSAAELEWIRAQGRFRTGLDGAPTVRKPCYFNTGCCCFTDGDVTGMEIADGEVRLVRWPDDQRRPLPRILEREPLADILARCREPIVGGMVRSPAI